MFPELQVNMMLADHVAAVDGKLYVNGGGWSRIIPGMSFGIAITAKVPWDRANVQHPMALELIDADGERIEQFPGLQVPIEVPRPLGVKPGTPLDWCGAIMMTPPPLEPGRYEFRISINGESMDDWRLAFEVVSPPPGAQQQAA